MQAILLTIGTEILIGQTQDTNSNYISKKLGEIGIEVIEIRSISDHPETISNALVELTEKADIIISTGGLGPTKDDITKKILAEFLDSPLVYSEETFEHIKDLFKKIGRVPNDINKEQAYHPKATEILKNDVGTAPGLWTERKGNLIINLPGVPYEMKHLIGKHVLPRIQAQYNLPFILHKNLLTMGVPESELSVLLEPFENNLPKDISLAYLPSGGRVKLRLSLKHQSQEEGLKQLEEYSSHLKSILRKDLYSDQTDSIEQLIGEILVDKKLHLAFAESCTAGSLAQKITSIAGSSKYFKGSVVAYSSSSKKNILNTPEHLIDNHTVVSTQVAESMAKSAQKLFNVDVACSATGVAGPSKGEDNKDIGTFCFAIAVKNKIYSHQKILPNGSREQFNIWASNLVLQELYKILLEN